MALRREAAGLAFMVSLMALCGACFGGAVYKVGESDGWAGNVDYRKWATNKAFFVGDTIVFEYEKTQHNVIQVDPVSFALCIVSKKFLLPTHSTGKDTIKLSEPGVFFFICGFPGHCKAGQRVVIIVFPAPIPGPMPSQPWGPIPAPPGDSASSQLPLN